MTKIRRRNRSAACHTKDGKVFCPDCKKFLFRIEALILPQGGFGILVDLNCSKCHTAQEVMIINGKTPEKQRQLLEKIRKSGNSYNARIVAG